MKVKPRQLAKKERERTLAALYAAVGTLKGRNATNNFLQNLLTESEQVMLGRRILIARELLAGTSQNDIAAEMEVGYDTIARVQEWVSEQMPGYKEIVRTVRTKKRRTTETEDEKAEKARRQRIYHDDSLGGLLAQYKLKYPLHFLLFPWPAEHRPQRKSKKH